MFMEEGDILGHEAMGVVEERPTDPETGEVGLPEEKERHEGDGAAVGGRTTRAR
jgi:hypothetical protein